MSGIRVNVVDIASTDVLGAILYAPRTQDDVAFLQSQTDPRLWQNLTESGRKFMEQSAVIQQQYQTVNYLAQQEAYRHHSTTNQDYVVYVTEPEQIRQIGLAGQRVIMASPYVHSLYNQGRIDGFSDSWTNINPDMAPEHTYDYHRLHDGWVQTDGTFSQFSDVDIYGEAEMSLLEKSNAHMLVNLVEDYLRGGIDVTNVHDPDATVVQW